MNLADLSHHEPIIGIDLGTTNSLVAWCDESGPRIIPDEQGRSLLPSVVHFDPQTGQPMAIGHEARSHAVEFPTDTVFSVKRLMGRGMGDVQNELAYLPYQVVQGDHDTARVQVGKHIFSPQEISAIILTELRRRAERYFKRPVRKAVITVPAYFDDAQRQATRDAGRIAGLQVLRIVNEPTAASLAYGLGLRNNPSSASHTTPTLTPGCPSGEKKNSLLPIVSAHPPQPSDLDHPDGNLIAVFDLGGGTFDVSILRLQQARPQPDDDSTPPTATPTATAIDQVLSTHGNTHLGGDDVDRMIVELIQREIRLQFGDSINFPPATRQAFRNLAEAAKIRLSDDTQASIEVDLGQNRIYRRTIQREEFDAMIGPWVQRTIDSCRVALKAAKLQPQDIQRVVMVGGSTRIPLVRQQVAEFFQSEPYTALNPDEVVALGAAVQGSILAGIHRDMLLLDVIPLSLGIETLGGAVAKLIVANTTIPARATEMFTTYAEGQTSVKIHVLQGERELVQDCRSLGEFHLKGIPPMPAGLPKIQVTFLIDANGILNVSAIEERSGKSAGIQIVPHHGLTRAEVAAMETASLQNARADMTAHRLIDLRNQARLDIRNIQRQIERVKDELEPDYQTQINQQVANVQRFIDDPKAEPDAFHQALDAMDKSTVRLAEIAIRKTLSDMGR